MHPLATPDFAPPSPTGERRRSARRRRLGRTLFALIVVLFATIVLVRLSGWPGTRGEEVLHQKGQSVVVPSDASASPLRKRIVSIAERQLGYASDPPGTYCNKYSAYWHSGTADCGNANLDEEWCADFAAWVWQRAGARVVYQYLNGDLNSSSASFYEWGLRTGTWHPVGSGYVPQPGDVAVYGLNPATLVATHVAVVIGHVPGARGPVAINGDGDLTGFSVVEVRGDEYDADVHPAGAPLSGYVSPS